MEGMEQRSLVSYFERFAEIGAQCGFIVPRGYRWERWSYRRVAEAAYRFARELQSRQVAKGDAVLLWSSNCAEWVAAFWGCALSGVIAVPIDDGASPDFAQRVAVQVKAKLVICPRERASALGEIACIDPDNFHSAVAPHSPLRFRPVEIQPSEPLEIVFTSGTTAEPKGVVISHANVVGNIAPIETEMQRYLKYERLVHPIRFLNLLPLSHVFGQFLGMFLPPLLSGTVVFQQTLNPSEVIATIRRERISVLVAVPRMIESLQRKIDRDLEDGGQRDRFARRFAASAAQHLLRRWWTFRDIRSQFGWKFWAMISGGAALNRETEEFWHRLGYAVIQGYGLTETTSLISLNHPFRTSRGSIGKVLPGREIKLAEDGEILVRGSGIASGYFTGGELTTVAGAGGWYGTGDRGELDAEGNLHFKGRKKEVIVTAAGMNIYPEDLEAALRKQKEIRDCVVIGLENDGSAEALATLILRDRAIDAATVVARANESLADYQRIRHWWVWPEEDFPRTSTGKPRRNEVREAAAGKSGARARSQDVPGSAASPLAALIARVSGRAAQSVSSTAKLENDLGLSSLERVELLGALEDRYQVDLSETGFSRTTTVGDVERLLQGEGGERGGFHYPRWTLGWPATWLRLAAHYLLVRPAVFVLGWPRVMGRENLREVRGPVLVIANHIGDVDVGFIQTVLPARIRHRLVTATGGEALEALRSPEPGRWWGGRVYDGIQWLLAVALLNLFPLPRQAGFRKSFAYAGEAVDRGYSVLVFPEGRHTEDGGLREFRSGVGLLVNNLRIPVVPLRIDGLFEIKQAGKKFAAPGKIRVEIGKALTFAPNGDAAEIARELRHAVESL